MDDLTTLRAIRADVPSPDPEALSAARERVMARALSQPRPTRPKIRRPLILGVSGLAAASVIAALAIAFAPGQIAPASATELLREAASASVKGATLDVPAGSYLRVTVTENALSYVVDDDGAYIGGYVSPTVDITYVPRDTAAEWVEQSYTEKPSVFYGGRAVRDSAARDLAESATKDDPNVDRASGGLFGNGELGGGRPEPVADVLAGMPRDPKALLSYLKKGPGVDADSSDEVMQAIGSYLRSGLVPPDLQSAMYGAIALLPDVVILEDQTDLDGRSGTAIGVEQSNGGAMIQFIIDAASGQYLGERQIQTDEFASIPAGTAMDWTSVATEVVSAAP